MKTALKQDIMVEKAFTDQTCCTACCHPLSHQQVSLARSPPLKDEEGHRVLLSSYDRTLVVKEISSEEVEEMHNILSEYHQVGLTQGGDRRLNVLSL